MWLSDTSVRRPVLAAVLLFLTAGFFSLAGLMNAMFAKKFDDISFVPTFVLTPLTYLGGVFYPLSSLPEFWQKISAANPILHMVSSLRYAFLGHSDVPYGYALAFLLLGNAALYYVSLRYLKRGLGIRN
mgnify:CR=1 FL=1